MSVRQWRLWGQALGLFLLVLVGVRAQAADDASNARLKKDITYLASDECEGRGVGTHGNALAGDYIAGEFKKAGVKPGGKDGSYFQPFTVNGVTLEGMPRLALYGPEGRELTLSLGKQFAALGLARSGEASKAPLVFAGYGLTITRDGKDVYDDYKDLDIKGKVVLVLRDSPPADTADSPFQTNPRARTLNAKLSNAEKRGAAALVFVNSSKIAEGGDDLLVFTMNANDGSTTKLPVFQVHRSLVEDLLKGTSKGLEKREEAIAKDGQPQSTELMGWTASFDITTTRGVAARNVVGVLEGSGPLKDETVVVGAHYDHLGYGITGQSLARLSKPAIHHGADDNGSGTVSVLELARRFARIPNREGRRLVFILFSGEELGLLGSQYYCKEPLFPLDKTVAMLNLDMVGRLVPDKETQHGHLIVYGAGSAKPFDELINKLGRKYEFTMVKKHDGIFYASDHASFYTKKVPVIFFFTDDHPDYHRPSDTADKINFEGMARIVDMSQEILEFLTKTERPAYIQLPNPTFTYGGMPRVGIRPSYGDDKEGVLLEGVVKDGPAAKAGMKDGDRIVEINGKPVKNLEDYMSKMASQPRNKPIEFQVMREGKKVAIQVTPE